MRYLILATLAISCAINAFSQNTAIGIGTTSPHPSAALEVKDSIRGLLPPRLTYAQRNLISSPAAGLIVYCTDCGTTGEMQYFDGNQWILMAMGSASAPVLVTTNSINSISYYSASGEGNVSYSNSSSPVTVRGICWGTSQNPTVSLSTKTTNGSGSGIFTGSLTNLTPGTTYYVRAYASNTNGTAYGNQIFFTTPALDMPVVATADITDITSNSAVTGGQVTDSNGVAVTSRGVCWSTSPNPTVSLTTKTIDGGGIGSFASNVTGLSPNTNYYLRAYAINSIGVSYGAEKIFTSAALTVPVLTTSAVNFITNTLAVSGGNISSDGGSAITLRGVCWDTLPNPTVSSQSTSDGTGIGIFSSNISGLLVGKTYYMRAYAINGVGTAYGNEVSFSVYNYANLPSVTIGNQIWQAKNLDIATFRNGDPIPQVTYGPEWNGLTTSAWCWYNNDSTTYGAIYGRLYNGYAVADPRGLCPVGWHVPSDLDFISLETQFGGIGAAGGALKSTTGWLSPNTGATNSTGFSALPGGRRENFSFGNVGKNAYFWTSDGINRTLYYNFSDISAGSVGANNGYSVRCVRD